MVYDNLDSNYHSDYIAHNQIFIMFMMIKLLVIYMNGGVKMGRNFEGQYIDSKSGKTYEIEADKQEGSGVIGMSFHTSCGLKVSAITMEDGSRGMILEDQTPLVRLT